MAVSEFALITLADAKAFLGLTDAVAERDTWLEAEIQRQSVRVESYLDRRVKARFYREDIPAQRKDAYTLYPKQTPIVEVVNLYADADREFGSDTLVDTDDYHVSRNHIEFSDGVDWGGYWVYAHPNRLDNIRLEYVAGWGVIEIPFSRQRIDLKEESGGDRMTFYLDAGLHTPQAILQQLNTELNTAGDHTREVSFDWRTRQFEITQTGGTLTLITSETGEFTTTHSVLPLLGFSGSGLTPSPVRGTSLALGIPEDLKGAVLQLLQLDYDKSKFGAHKSRGLRSIQIAEYRATFGNADGTSEMSGFPKEIEAVLDQYKHWNLV